MWRTLGRLKPTVVAINGIYPTMLIAAIWSFVHRVPLAFLTDGWRPTMPQSIFHRVVRALVVKRCRAIICASEKGRRFFIESGVNPLHIFVAHIAPAWAAPVQLPEFDRRPYHIIWCARLDDADKNPFFFVELAVTVHKRFADLRIKIIGDGALRQSVTGELSRAGVVFDYVPYVPPEKMADAFATARVLVLPSTKEPWGLVCNEAMQCGTLCAVSSYTGAADELVENGRSGFVLELDLGLWAKTILDVTNNRELWTKMSKAAIQSAAVFNLDYYSKMYLEGLIFAARGNNGNR
jgi:glycosyltransferase involved in cell wall biosynthesis